MASKTNRYQPFVSKYLILFLIFASFLFIGWGIFMAVDYSLFAKKAEKTTAVLKDIDVHYRSNSRRVCDAYFEYTVDGSTYGFYVYRYARGSSFRIKKENFVGRHMNVLYDPKIPQHARAAKPPYNKSALLAAAGIAALVMSVYFRKKNDFYQRLLTNGAVVDAVVTEIKTNAVSGNSSYRRMRQRRLMSSVMQSNADYDSMHNVRTYSTIICEWVNPVTNRKYVFRSCQVKEFVEPYVGQTVRVYADPTNYEKYFVDVDDLLSKPFMTNHDKHFTYGGNP